jgi:hypothetical protein
LSDEETEELISDLAALSPATYDQQRGGAAAKLRMRLPTLDQMVKAVRDRSQPTTKLRLLHVCLGQLPSLVATFSAI